MEQNQTPNSLSYLKKTFFAIGLALVLCVVTIILVETFTVQEYEAVYGEDATGIFKRLQEAKDADIVLLGSSITFNHLQPVIMEHVLADITGTRPVVWNLGCPSTFKMEHYHILKRYLKKHPGPALVMVDIRYFEFTAHKMSGNAYMYPTFWELVEIVLLRNVPFDSRKPLTNAMGRSIDYPVRKVLGDWRGWVTSYHTSLPVPENYDPEKDRVNQHTLPIIQGYRPIPCDAYKKNSAIYSDERCDLDTYLNNPDLVPEAMLPKPSIYDQVIDYQTPSTVREYKEDSSLIWDALVHLFAIVGSATGLGTLNTHYLIKLIELCQAHDASLIIWAPPQRGGEPAVLRQHLANRVKEAIQQPNVYYVSFDRDAIGLPRAVFKDEVHHVFWASNATTRYVAHFIAPYYNHLLQKRGTHLSADAAKVAVSK